MSLLMDAHHNIVLDASSTFCYTDSVCTSEWSGAFLTRSNMAVYVTFDYYLIGVFGDRGSYQDLEVFPSRHCYSNA